MLSLSQSAVWDCRTANGTARCDIRLLAASLAGGGSERVCLRLANQWAQEGKRVMLLLIRGDGPYLASLDPRVIVRIAGYGRVRWALPWLAVQLWRDPFVPVLAFGPDVGAIAGLLKRAGLISVPVIYREGSQPEVNVPKSRAWVYPGAIGYLNGVIVQTEVAGHSLRRMGVHVPLRRIVNPVDRTRCQTTSHSALNADLGAPVNLVSVGRLSQEKRFDLLLRTLAVCRDKGLQFRLRIAGEGELRSELEKLTQSLEMTGEVSFLGWIDDVSQLYDTADVFVLASEYEGLPNVLLEALLSGCRVLASGGAGVQEILAEVGLSDCYLNETDFGAGFGVRIESVLSALPSRWEHAKELLCRMTDVRAVAGEYFEFCRCVSSRISHVY